ncbi:hypothetical protein EI94DRAFT_1708915, partial [Lactarius quietus]
MPSGELDMREGGLSSDDDEEGDYSQLDKMATKDAKTLIKPRLQSSTGGSMQIADLICIFKEGKHPTVMGWMLVLFVAILEGCRREKVEPNWRILSVVGKAPEETRQLQEQRSLDGWTIAKTSQRSKQGLMEPHCRAFSLWTVQPFDDSSCSNPSTKDCDIPHHTSIAKAVHEKAQKVKDILKELFASVPGEVSVTLDGWSSLACDPYLGHRSLDTLHPRIPPANGLSARLTSKTQLSMNGRLHTIASAKHIIQAFSQEGPLMESDFPVMPPPQISTKIPRLGSTVRKLLHFSSSVALRK